MKPNLLYKLFIAILAPVWLYAETSIGVCGYGMMSRDFPCRSFLGVFNGVSDRGLSVLWGRFGSSRRCLYTFLDDCIYNNCSVLIHFNDETCRRHGVCGGGVIDKGLGVRGYNRRLSRESYSTILRVKKRVGKINALIFDYPEVNWSVSTGLEDNYTPRAFRAIRRVLEDELVSGTKIVRNPVNLRRDNSITIEAHGLFSNRYSSKGCIYSNDGIDVRLSDRRRILDNGTTLSTLLESVERARDANCEVYLWWNNQGAVNRDERFIQPYRRNIRVLREDIRRVNNILKMDF